MMVFFSEIRTDDGTYLAYVVEETETGAMLQIEGKFGTCDYSLEEYAPDNDPGEVWQDYHTQNPGVYVMEYLADVEFIEC